MMSVGAVVLNWKDDTRTLRCVAALLESPLVSHVYVVDNESTGSLQRAIAGNHVDRVTVIELPENRGFAGGVNVALARCLLDRLEALLVVNNDAVIEDASVALLLKALEGDPKLGLVAPRILNPDRTEESAGGYLSPLIGQTSHRPRHKTAPDFITWACVLVRSETLRTVGLLDENFFMYWEDVDYSRRLLGQNWRFSVVADAVAVHETSTNRSSYPVAIKAYHTWSSIVFARKHGERWRLGNPLWLATTTLANLVRGRKGALEGIRFGVRLAQESASPAHTSPIRKKRFGGS